MGQEDKQEWAKAEVKHRGRDTTFHPALSYPWDICGLQGRVNASIKSSLWVPGTLLAPRSMYWGVCPEDHTQSRFQLSERHNILSSDGTIGQSCQQSVGIHFPRPCQHLSLPVFISLFLWFFLQVISFGIFNTLVAASKHHCIAMELSHIYNNVSMRKKNSYPSLAAS